MTNLETTRNGKELKKPQELTITPFGESGINEQGEYIQSEFVQKFLDDQKSWIP
ncbi:MAG: hypothetical protein WCG98_08845 [bacterium]